MKLPEYKFKDKAFKKKGKMRTKFYEKELLKLQIELVKLQTWLRKNNKRMIILFEGIDTAGKDGTIKRILEHLNPRFARSVALDKPSDREKTQWYFQRYVPHFPSGGEMVLFDRSWYNRAGVERVMGFCTKEEYLKFIRQCPRFEEMIVDDGIKFFKYWLNISKEEMYRRLKARETDPLKKWKLSSLDWKSYEKYDEYQKAKEDMFASTSTPYAPWVIVDANDKKRARINIIRDILSQFEYDEKAYFFRPDSKIIKVVSHIE
ncbi:MAG: polyphosphate kinase 2 [Nautiliaceae bacterium]|jgi:polyphosphate kinase 2